MKMREVSVRVYSRGEASDSDDEPISHAEGLSLVWELTKDAWAFKGERLAESGLQRHVVHIQRRKR
jgi:hypothetical protein